MDDVVFVIDGLLFSFLKKKFCIYNKKKTFGWKMQMYLLLDHSKSIDNWIFKLPKHKWEEPKKMIQFFTSIYYKVGNRCVASFMQMQKKKYIMYVDKSSMPKQKRP